MTRVSRSQMDTFLRGCNRQDVADFADSFYNMVNDGAIVALTDGATISWDVNDGWNASVTLGGNRTLSMSNMIAGQCYNIAVTQDGTGSRTLALPEGSLVVNSGAGAITLSTAAGAVDLLSCYYNGVNHFWSYGLRFT